MSRKMLNILDVVAEKLEARGETKLAFMVDRTATALYPTEHAKRLNEGLNKLGFTSPLMRTEEAGDALWREPHPWFNEEILQNT